MENNRWLTPFFFLTRVGLAFLYILRDLWHRPNRNTIERPEKNIGMRRTSRVTSAAQLPSHRYEFGAAAIGNMMYVAGGIFQPSVWLPTARFEAYNARLDTWTDLPNVPHVTHHPGVAADSKYLYVIGGCGIRISPLSFVWRYTPQKRIWERLPDMPTPRGALGLTHIDNKLYAVGGADYGKKYAVLESYDVASSVWSRLPDMPTPREHLAAAAAAGKLHVLGGYNTDRFGALTTHEVYDPKTRIWSTAAPLPMRLCGFSAAAYKTSIFVFGGEQGWAVSPFVFEYDCLKNRWLRHPDLSQARYASTAVSIGKRIHVLGGNIRMFSNDFSNKHDVFTP